MAVFPQLKVQKTDGVSDLSFPWAEFTSRRGSTMDASLGHGGVSVSMSMLINWSDIETAAKELLGYPRRDPGFGGYGTLHRYLPWRHPLWNQLWCTKIARATGVRSLGKSGAVRNGPVGDYQLALLTLRFERPPYAILPDSATNDLNLNPTQEWVRYTDRNWEPSIEMLSREGTVFQFLNGPPAGKSFQGSVGQKLPKLKLKRRWYELPRKAIYDSNGFPVNLISGANNSSGITGAANNGTGQIEITQVAHGYVSGQTVSISGVTGTTEANGTWTITVIDADHYRLEGSTFIHAYVTGGTAVSGPLLGTVNASTFFGMPAGTLLYAAIEIIPQPPGLPPELMGLGDQELGADDNLLYDVVFHFEHFDPPVGKGVSVRGHNLMPYSGDGYWYDVYTQIGNNPPFGSSDFTRLWRVL